MTTAEPSGLAIYIHWPFCDAICPYCDFNVYRNRSVDEARWVAALIAQLDHFHDRTAALPLRSVFWGGGTPSLLSAGSIDRVMRRIHDLWPRRAQPVLEVALEANPTSVEAGRFSEYAAAGINRLSLGIQSLDDGDLRFLGRQHDAGEALAALETATGAFDNVSVDLIYALPGQSIDHWSAQLAQVLQTGVNHLSAYQLTIEPGTAFSRQVNQGRWQPADEDITVAMFDLTQQLTAAHGLTAYETSNHARPGFESQHNMTYWTGGPYLGVGPGAHGRLPADGGGMLATVGQKTPGAWLAAVEADESGLAEEELLDPRARAEEMLFMGLRLKTGVDLVAITAATGLPEARLIDQGQLSILQEAGFLMREGGRIRLTDAGRPVLNEVVRRLTPA